MCLRVVSTFEMCHHQDNIAHLQYCQKALKTNPSLCCNIPKGETTSPVYNIRGYCPPCSLNRTVVTMTGHLQEGISSVNIVYQVPTAVKAKQFTDLSTSKKNNDTPLEWKETVVGGGDFANFGGVGGGDDWDKPDAAVKDVDAGWGDGAADNWGGGSAAGESFKDSIGTVATVQDDNVGGNDNWADAVHEEEQNGGGFNGHQEEVESFNW